MSNVLIAFYSRDGMTEALANAVCEGAQAGGGAVRMRRAREVVSAEVMAAVPGWTENAERMNAAYEAPTPDDVLWADAVVLGTPSRFGLVCSEMKAFLDSLGALWAKGRMVNKVGSAFTASATVHGGNEMTSLTLFVPMTHFGMIIVPPGYGDPAMFAAGTPYGASAVSHNKPGARPTDAELNAARYQGQRVAQVAQALKSAL